MSSSTISQIEVKIKKADQARKISDVEYQSSITKLHEVHSKWKEDMITACEVWRVLSLRIRSDTLFSNFK